MPALKQSEGLPYQILTLGPPLVVHHGSQVRINRREQRVGLYYLAAQPEPVSRAEICDLFWPKESEQASRKKLREGLSRLRGCLQDPDIIITNNDSITLDFSRVYVDLHEFNAIVKPLLTSAEMNLGDKLPDWCYDQLRKAINLCRGTEFLQGIIMPDSTGFENWVSFNNISYSYAREKILQRLIDHNIALGNNHEAIIWLERSISSDPLNSENSYLMLKCLKETGRDKEAESYLQFLENLYRNNQFGPLPQTLEGFKDKKRYYPATKSVKGNFPDWPSVEQNAVPFVGREEYLIRLNNAYQRKGMVYITGEAGMGKNRLVQEFYASLQFKPKLMFCTGKPMLNPPPLTPIMEGLKALVTDDQIQALPVAKRTEIQSLYQECQDHYLDTFSDLISPIQEEYKSGLFEKITDLLIFLRGKKPLLMVIDIIQWCDASTYEFLHYLNEQNFFSRHGALILIGRQEERNSFLDVYLDRSVLAFNLEKIVLPPLTYAEANHLVSLVRGKPVPDQLVQQIYLSTGGNPFFLMEILKSDVLDRLSDNEISFQVPETIRAMVHEKQHLLSQTATKTLQTAAILGRRFLSEVLKDMVSISSDTLIEALEELQSKAIIKVEPPVNPISYYCFSQDLVREVLLEEMSPVRKQALHLRAVQSLRSVKSNLPEKASMIAWHYSEAGDKTNACKAWCEAAEQANASFERGASYQAYQNALDLLPALPADDVVPLLQQLLILWGDLAYDLADDQTCEKLYSIGLSVGEHNQHPLLIGMSLNGLARAAEMRGETHKGLDLNQQAFRYLESVPDEPELVNAYTQKGVLLELNSDYFGALDSFLQGQSLMRKGQNPRNLDVNVSLLIQLSLTYSLMGYPSKAEEVALSALSDSRLVKRRSARVQAATVLAVARHFQGKYKLSLENANSVYELALKLKLDWWIVLLDLVLARNHLVLGHLDECWHFASHVSEVASPPNSWPLSAYGCAIKGDALRYLSDLDAAASYYQKGSKNPFTEYQTLENYLLLGMTLCQNNKLQQGLEILKQVHAPTEACGLGSLSLLARYMIEIYTSPGLDDPASLERIMKTSEELKARGFGDRWMIASFVQALTEYRKGNMTEAKRLFLQLAETARGIEHSWWELEACAGLNWIMDQSREERRKLHTRMTSLLDAMAVRATKKEVSGMFQRYRRMLEGSF